MGRFYNAIKVRLAFRLTDLERKGVAVEARTIRPPAVAGMFYPGNVAELSGMLDGMLRSVSPASTFRRPKAMIIPHAGYAYSGPIAASAYARLAPFAKQIKRIVLFGPCHRVAVRGLAAPSVDAFASPLGNVSIDKEALASVRHLPQVLFHDEAHAQEHSIEVHLPFLQTVLGDFRLAPFAVGYASPHEVAEVMDQLWGGAETLIVVSSDLSHFHDYANAQQRDGMSVDTILHLRPLTDHEQACGATPINGLIETARRRHLSPQLLDLRNSGDTAGDKARVVGYTSIAFTEPDMTDQDFGTALLTRARNAIAAEFGSIPQQEPVVSGLNTPGATFVTLTQNGQLRGCIGSLEARRPLEEDVRANAHAAAFSDPRFPPLSASELERTRVEVSVLTPAVPMTVADEADAIRQMQPGIDGMIFECQGRRSTFLPQVWESLPDRRDFFAHLKQKAGFAPEFWSPDVKLYRYEVRKWKEPEKS